MEKIPDVRKIGIEMGIIQALITSRLGWSQQQFCDFQEDAGYLFLNFVTKGAAAHDTKLFSHSFLFWKWWRNQWFMRDRDVYNWEDLTTDEYIDVHTYDLHESDTLYDSFWNHAESMIYNGERHIINSKKREVLA